MKLQSILLPATLFLLVCATCVPATAGEPPKKTQPHPVLHHPVLHHPVPKLTAPGASPADAGETDSPTPARPAKTSAAASAAAKTASVRAIHAKANLDSQYPPHQRRHHWRHYTIVDINVYIRPSVYLVGPIWARDPMLQTEAETLRAAYIALSRADHDYDGHRYAAMRQTAITGNLLGVYLRGDGNGQGESQEASDAQLAAARDLLAQVYDGLIAKGYPDPAGYVDQAIQEISLGLGDN